MGVHLIFFRYYYFAIMGMDKVYLVGVTMLCMYSSINTHVLLLLLFLLVYYFLSAPFSPVSCQNVCMCVNATNHAMLCKSKNGCHAAVVKRVSFLLDAQKE